jgi:hypothetical protein
MAPSSRGRNSLTSETTTTFVWTSRPWPPQDERTSREGERHDLARLEATHLQATREIPSKVGDRATIRAVEFAYHAVSSNGLHAYHHGAWLGSGPTYRHRLRQPTSVSIHRGRQPGHARGCDRPTRRGAGRGVAALRQVPASLATLPRAQRAPSRVPHRGLGPPTSSGQQGLAQAITASGGAVHHPRNALTRNLQDSVQGREGRLQCMEHRTPTPFHP